MIELPVVEFEKPIAVLLSENSLQAKGVVEHVRSRDSPGGR
jgi:hypothetical protein